MIWEYLLNITKGTKDSSKILLVNYFMFLINFLGIYLVSFLGILMST